MKHLIHCGFLLLTATVLVTTAAAQAQPRASEAAIQKIYDQLLKQIEKIPIYDNHSHATFPDDSDMDAMAGPPDETSVLRLRDTNPEFVTAAKSLFGYPYNDFQPGTREVAHRQKESGREGWRHGLLGRHPG